MLLWQQLTQVPPEVHVVEVYVGSIAVAVLEVFDGGDDGILELQ